MGTNFALKNMDPTCLRGVQKCTRGSPYFSKISSCGSKFFEIFGPGGPNLGGSKSVVTGPLLMLFRALVDRT